MRKTIFLFLVVCAAGIIAAVFVLRYPSVRLRFAAEEEVPQPLPREHFMEDTAQDTRTKEPATPPEEPEETTPPQEPSLQEQDEESQKLPEEINLAIPFTSQAPHANWDMPYQEFCEEASVYMVAAYFLGEPIPSADVANTELLTVMEFENRHFGYYKDTTAEETAEILRLYYGMKNVRVVANMTKEDIYAELAQGHPIIVPAAGQLLGNPYFHQPGPLYHALVLKGYLQDGRLITNDPGTRRGADYIYTPETILNANHDWNGGNVVEG